jgi:GntR family transcriptional regulator
LFLADEVVEAGLADTEEARLLGIRRKSAVFLFTRTSYVQDGRPVEFVKSTYRADRYKIVSRLTRLTREFWVPRTTLM